MSGLSDQRGNGTSRIENRGSNLDSENTPIRAKRESGASTWFPHSVGEAGTSNESA